MGPDFVHVLHCMHSAWTALMSLHFVGISLNSSLCTYQMISVLGRVECEAPGIPKLDACLSSWFPFTFSSVHTCLNSFASIISNTISSISHECESEDHLAGSNLWPPFHLSVVRVRRSSAGWNLCPPFLNLLHLSETLKMIKPQMAPWYFEKCSSTSSLPLTPLLVLP